MEYYPAIKKEKETLAFAIMRMDPEGIIYKVSQSDKNKHCMNSLIYQIKKANSEKETRLVVARDKGQGDREREGRWSKVKNFQ